MQAGTHSVLATSQNLGHAKNNYTAYSDKINRTHTLVDEIVKAEQWDEMKLQYSFKFLLISAFYMILKRFYLWEIIYAIIYIFKIFIYGLNFW